MPFADRGLKESEFPQKIPFYIKIDCVLTVSLYIPGINSFNVQNNTMM